MKKKAGIYEGILINIYPSKQKRKSNMVENKNENKATVFQK